MSVLKVFNKKESGEIKARWMGVFCKNKQGYDTKSYKWHIFSGGGYPSVEGSLAQEEYQSHFAERYLIMPNNDGCIELVDEKPTDLNHYDIYVFPRNMSWTMAFTHEEGWLGPYFAKHPNYEELEKENEKYKVKLEEIAHAKSKGWC